MANFDLQINEQAFAQRGVRVGFDEGLYGRFLDEIAPITAESEYPSLNLTPQLAFGQNWLIKAILIGGASPAENIGEYDPDKGLITVSCPEDALKANKILLHESKHWADDKSGELAKGTAIQKRNGYITMGVAGVAGAAVGAVAYLCGESPNYGATVMIPTLPAIWYFGYYHTPHERAARRLASDPDIIREYGRIISYSALS